MPEKSGYRIPDFLFVEEVKDDFTAFVQFACMGDFDGVRRMLAEGFDIRHASGKTFGETILENVIWILEFMPDAPKYDIVRELLKLGADASVRNNDGFGPLFQAVLHRDAEMLAILLEAGADPNKERMDLSCQSLYDWALFDYREEVWHLSEPEEDGEPDYDDKDAWLAYIDACALKYGKERPAYLMCLRNHGALSMQEMCERGMCEMDEKE